MKNSRLSFLTYSLYRAFTNPVFYITGLIFDLFCVLNFFVIQNFSGGGGSANLTAFFQAIPYISIISVPVLTLNSTAGKNQFSPVSRFFRIFTSFLTLFLQFTAILLPLFEVPFVVNLFGSTDYGQVFTGFSGIFLYFCLASAISVFIFLCFENSQAIPFIISAVCLGLTNSIYLLNGYFAGNSFITSVLKFISFSWHFDSFQKGLLDSRDIIFFLNFTVVFLFAAFFSDYSKAGKKITKTHVIQYTTFVFALIFVFLDSSRYFFRTDLTFQKKFTVSEYSKKLFSSAESEISLTYYRSRVLKSLYPEFSDVEDYLNELSSIKNVKVSVLEPDESLQKNLLQNYSRQIQTRGKNKTEYLTVFSVLLIEYKGSSSILPFVSSINSLEYDLDQNLTCLYSGKKRSVNFVSTDNLSMNEYFSNLSADLHYNGFEVNDFTQTNENLYEKITEHGGVTVVLGGDNLNSQNLHDLESLIFNGNKVLFAVNPYKIDFENDWHIIERKNKKLQEMIENWGIYFSTGLINDISCARITMQSDENTDGSYNSNPYTTQINYPFWIQLLPQANAVSGITLFWPASINSSLENAFPVLFSSNMSFLQNADFESPENLFITNPFELEKQGWNPSNETQQNLACGYYFNGNFKSVFENREGKGEFAVISDPLFCNDLMLGYLGDSFSQLKNLDFMVNILLKLNGEPELAELQNKINDMNMESFWKVPDEESFKKAENILMVINFICLPVFWILILIIVYIAKKRFIKRLSEIIK